MAKPAPRTLQVLCKQPVTRNMLRVTLGGEGMQAFPDAQAGAYIKLIFPATATQPQRMRTYTVRAQRPGEIDVDFVRHADDGPASSWAEQCSPGDTILIGGPGPRKPLPQDADGFVVVGDMTALPAISVNLESLPVSACGVAVLEVIDPADIQPLNAPTGIALNWLVNPEPGSNPAALVERLRQIDWPAGRVNVWAACEFASMRALREFLREERQIVRSDLYISSYWKHGASEDQHKQEKRGDAEQDTRYSA